MWMPGQVDVPEPVLLAQQQGRLVLFVGAGVSAGPPSSLPLFVHLAKGIAGEAHAPLTDEVETHPDHFLGRLEASGVPVHARVKAIVEQSVLPNRVHEALVGLFPSQDQLRIVTTNYDQHLTTAAIERFGAEPPLYKAPALPLGRDFTGIVHLHGCVDQRPQDLIVTARDFGRAYLTDAWAARFLPEMFRTYTVLFVGYSHNDQVMTYLAHGLPPESQRFGFIEDTVPAKWTAMGITGLPYSSADHHVALGDALEGWAALSAMGRLDHERRIKDLVARPTPDADGTVRPVELPKDPAMASYLERAIRDKDTVGLFTKHASDVILLSWISDQDPFAPLFLPRVHLDPVAATLAAWFADRFAVAETDAALSVVHRRSGWLHPEAAMYVINALIQQNPAPDVVGRWLPILIASGVNGWYLT